MAWTAPTTATFLQVSFMATEVATIRSLQGNGDTTAAFLQLAVDAMRGYIRSGGYPLDNDNANTVPAALHRDVYAICRWDMLTSLPQLKAMQTDDRQKAAEDAHKKGGQIAAQKFEVEPPVETDPPEQHTGSWNSENPLIMRTHPVPPASTQYPPQSGDYANS